ncbi:hypothetical protein FB451DRAFT_1412512 [Mycena latifolia]|nr:hypothetical protein FB451DRAFT_1412512 [Mycena latifolia]
MDLINPTPALDVQELWYHILGFLRGRTSDLKNLALVSRAMCPAAQSVLFYDIDLEPRIVEKDSMSNLTTQDFDASCRLLVAVLTKSPHLVKYIHRLKVTVTPDVLDQLCFVGLTSLRDIEIQFQNFRVDDSLIEPLQNLFSLPSIRRIELSSHVSPGLFSECVPHLTGLSFVCVHTFTPASVSIPVSRYARRPEIQTLLLAGSAPLDDWLVGPTCPFDFTRLVDVQIEVDIRRSRTMSTNLLRLLHTARSTIKRLTIAAYDFQERPIDLGQFHNMTHFYLHAENPSPLAFVIPSLSSLDGHTSLQYITLGIERLNEIEWVEAELRSIDAALADISLPALEQVEICLDVVYPPRDQQMSAAEREVLFRRALPNIDTKGILSIVMESEWINPRTRIKRDL